ncbi:hypothetical protein OPT61_g2350 [Boeremia exigua]|uniref:Uncharacterized protein n=1 Tax=Boeremia exigua TaxID=749465 RepID=A0ACC2IM12_9PLEO|nr:hypothetical protein OPT61_g2350 [Boeremia exigua]
MTEPAFTRRPRKPQVKTGCTTCRIRKVKCDETKPSCRRCVDSGRTCDGYRSLFRNHTSQTHEKIHIRGSELAAKRFSVQFTTHGTSSYDINLLNRYFHTKTIFDINLACEEDARQILETSQTYPSLSRAITSLITLREHFEKSRGALASIIQPIPSHDLGLEQYCLALKGLSNSLSKPLGSDETKATLLCCQIFVSIEQVRENYTAMANHISHALKIMRSHRARPSLDAADHLVPAHPDKLPLVDVFIIKLFTAPCGFADRESAGNRDKKEVPLNRTLPDQQPVEPRDFRRIAPNTRAELKKIAASTLSFLKEVSGIVSASDALRLRSEKALLLTSLDRWPIEPDDESSIEKLVIASFTRFLHRILTIVVLSALDNSPDSEVQLLTEYEHLQAIASNVDDNVKSVICLTLVSDHCGLVMEMASMLAPSVDDAHQKHSERIRCPQKPWIKTEISYNTLRTMTMSKPSVLAEGIASIIAAHAWL